MHTPRANLLSCLLFVLLALPVALPAQQADPLKHTWMLANGWLDQDTLRMVRIENPDTYNGWAQTFTFGENGALSYRLLLPEGRGVCGVGLLYVDEAAYKAGKRNKKLRFQVEGGHYAYDRFAYDVQYRILQLDDTEMVLRLRRVRKAEVVSEFGTELR